MARLSGQNGTVDWDTVGCDRGLTSWTLEVDADLPDCTGMDSSCWKEHVVGLKGWTADVVQHYDALDESDYQDKIAAAAPVLSAGNQAVLTLNIDAAPTLSYTGTATLKTFRLFDEVDGTIRAELHFQGTAELAYPDYEAV